MANFSIEFKKLEKPRLVVFRTTGYFDDLAGEKVKLAVGRYLELGETVFLFNFKNTPVINSVGVGLLMQIIEEVCHDRPGEIHFSDLSKTIYEVFRMIGLLNAYPVYETEEKALQQLLQNAG